MQNELKYELFKSIGRTFDAFLKDTNNDKILFSGKYGTGKTTFLQAIFNTPEALGLSQGNYEVFRISPVNYSVSSNDDILELIKYDILIEFLLKPHLTILTSDVPSYQLLSEKDIASVFEMILRQVSIKDVNLDWILDGLKTLKKGFDERKEALDEGDQFDEYLKRIESKTGIFERDIISRLIEKVLQRIGTEGNKQSVLVIDDFDRMDPDHIFRVLNVFSAHFDNETLQKRGQRNKFGFDKVIIVCDHRNLESLFHQRYGNTADFNGYLDKFYNRVVFDFDIKKEVSHYVQDVLFQMDGQLVKQYTSEFRYFGGQQDDLLEQTIINAILTGDLTIRTLSKLKGFHVEYHFERLSNALHSRTRTNYTFFLLALNLFIFGSTQKLYSIIERLFAAHIPLALDSYLLNLFISAELRLNRNHSDKEVKITTSNAIHTFASDSNDRWNKSNIQLLPGQSLPTNQHQSLDLIRYFLNRVDQLATR